MIRLHITITRLFVTCSRAISAQSYLVYNTTVASKAVEQLLYKLIPALSRLAWNKIPGISLLNNFLYEERGVRAWKAYKVGPGCFIPYDKVIIERQGDTGLKVIQPFGVRTKERGTIVENTRPLTEIFPCTETGFVLSFKTLDRG